MATLGSSTWTFSTDDGSHVVQANVTTGMKIRIFIMVDGKTVIEEKGNTAAGIWRDYVFRVGKHVCIVNARPEKEGWMAKMFSGKTTLDLAIDGVDIEPGEHVNLTSSKAQPRAPHETTLRDSPEKPHGAVDPTLMIPIFPPQCGSCGAPVNMQDVEWTGPLTASCGTCRSAVDVEWKKLG